MAWPNSVLTLAPRPGRQQGAPAGAPAASRDEPRRRLGDIEIVCLGLGNQGCKQRIAELRPPIQRRQDRGVGGAFCSNAPGTHRVQCRWGRGGRILRQDRDGAREQQPAES